MEQEHEEIEIEEEEEETGPHKITKKRRSFTNETKLEIVHLAQNSSISNAARQAGLERQVVSKWCQTETALQNTGLKRRRLVGAGRKPLSEQLDDQVYEWIKLQRGMKLAVSRKSINARAIFLSGELELPNFSGSTSWLERFMARKGLSLRRATTVCQKPPAELVQRITDFLVYMRQVRTRGNYPLNLIYAADEVGVWLNAVSKTTVDVMGAREVGVRSTGNDRLRIAVLLAARADGFKLPPFVLIPRKRAIKELEKYRGSLHICYSGTSSWMDEEKVEQFLKTVIGRHVFGARKLLVWDSFRPHFSEHTKIVSAQLRIDLSIIPGMHFSNLFVLLLFV